MDDYLDDSITKRNEKQKEVEFELFPIENSLFIYFISIYLISIDIAFELLVFDECGYVIIDSGKYILEYNESIVPFTYYYQILMELARYIVSHIICVPIQFLMITNDPRNDHFVKIDRSYVFFPNTSKQFIEFSESF